MSTFLFTSIGWLHLSLWSRITIWCHFLIPIQLCTHPLSLFCHCQIYYISICHGSSCLYNYIKNQLKKKEEEMCIQVHFIITLLPLLLLFFFFMWIWIITWGHLLCREEIPLVFPVSQVFSQLILSIVIDLWISLVYFLLWKNSFAGYNVLNICFSSLWICHPTSFWRLSFLLRV